MFHKMFGLQTFFINHYNRFICWTVIFLYVICSVRFRYSDLPFNCFKMPYIGFFWGFFLQATLLLKLILIHECWKLMNTVYM